MKLVILYDNTARVGIPGWGFSCLVGGTLFDLGSDPSILKKNADALGIDLNRVKNIVISHEHSDHFGGLDFDAIPEFRGKNIFVGDFFSQSFKRYIKKNATLKPIDKATEITRGTTIVPMKKECFLIVDSDKGSTIITGCSHPGIVNIIKRAKELRRRIHLVIGGFHLAWKSKGEIDEIVKAFREFGVESVCPAHCSGEIAQEAFRAAYGEEYIEPGVGTMIEV